MRVTFALLLLAGAAYAQPMASKPPASNSPATVAFNEAAAKMMSGMNITYTGNADQDFVAGMVPHHQGAIDMAEIELKYGQDPKLKQLAGRIIAAQEREIAFMKAWQAKHPMPAPSGSMKMK